MKTCIIGAGAVGGLIGAKLAAAGNDVTMIDLPGPHLEAIQSSGLKLLAPDGPEIAAKNVTAITWDETAEKYDLVFLAVKSYQIPQVAAKIPPLFAPEAMLVTVQNGLPWWYFQKHGGPLDGQRLESVDPTGEIAAAIDPERIIGGVIYPAAAVEAPGVIHLVEGNRISVGELTGATTDRVKQLSELLVAAGFKSYVLEDVRGEIWLKAWGSLTFNPISALTRATMVDICQFPDTRELVRNMMEEAQATAGKLGITFRHTIDKRIAGAESVGKHKTSTLQDVEQQRPLEVDALVGSVAELGRLTETSTPHIDAVLACTRLLDKTVCRRE